jgi:serine/threonine protein kinase
LEHKKIVKFIEHFINTDLKTISLVMEYIDGGNLSDLVIQARRKELPIEEVARIFFEIL